MARFYMTIGIPSSGKSSYYKNHFNDDTIYLSSDNLREELLGDVNDQSNNSLIFNEMYKRAISALKAGQDVYCDSTAINRKRRVNLLKQLPACEKIAIVFAIPYDTCCERNENRERVVPQYVIERMYKSFQPPYFTEGFDIIKVIKDKTRTVGIEDILAENVKCPHDNPHHKFSCGEHCIEAAKQAATIAESKNFSSMDNFIVTAASRYHDVSKYKCKVFHNMKGETTKTAHYYGHENVSAYDYLAHTHIETYQILIANLIANHMIFFSGEKAIQKSREFYGEDFWRLLETIHEADLASH